VTLRSLATGLVLACVLLSLLPWPATASAASPAATKTAPVVGNVSGPSLLATGSNGTFYLNASGGPAEVDGSIRGELNWTANVTGTNTTGTSVSPKTGTISSSTSQPVKLVVTLGPNSGPFTLQVEVTSTLASENSSENFSRTFQVVVPYVVRATLVAGPSATVLPFNVTVSLDGSVVGQVAVPKLTPNATFDLEYRYATRGLASGYHTFTLTVEDVHGLVTFSNGRTVLSTTFYVAPAPPDYTLWVVVGIVAFFGVLFIYVTRAAARRRTPGRR